MNDILEGEASKLKSEAVTLPLDALDAFEKLKMCCMTVPVLAFADFEKEFQLETDMSSEGLGTVLSQKQLDGKWHPVAFRSHELKGGEAKYHSSMFGQRPRLPVDLLFPTVNNREWTRTIDKYVKALYERLRECLKLAQESATKEANRQKWLYDRRVGAV